MAGIYIHIPFCRQKCYYCDFYKTVNTDQTARFLKALNREIVLQKEFLNYEPVHTIYFGGGTPSVLSENQVNEVLKNLHQTFDIDPQAEITFEANPDDLNTEYLQMLKQVGINRLSIGIQSFQDDMLQRMNRRHNAEQSVNSVLLAENAGFDNISIDLIYGLPGLSNNAWKENLAKAFSLPASHLSAYHLTYHEGTPFYTWLKKGTLKELEEDHSLQQFNDLIDLSLEAGYEQYEISNFAKNKMYSRHNSSYWNGTTYLGLGPSAHSYTGNKRRWNNPHLEGYLKGIENETENHFEEELLSETDRFNEYVITHIRTKWGISLEHIKQEFGQSKADYFLQKIRPYVERKQVTENDDQFTLTRQGLFVSDDITASLMII